MAWLLLGILRVAVPSGPEWLAVGPLVLAVLYAGIALARYRAEHRNAGPQRAD